METGSLPTMSMRILRPNLVPSWMEMLGTKPINLDKDFVQDESIEPLWPIHGGNPESLENAEWIFDDNLIALLQVSTLPGR